MWNWNQFKNLPRNRDLSAQEQSRQYFIYQSNMMYEASVNNTVATAAAAAGSGGGSLAIPTFRFKSNQNLFSIYFDQGDNLEGELTIDWGDGTTDTYYDQDFYVVNHTYDKQVEDEISINFTTNLDVYGIYLYENRITELKTGELPSSLEVLDLYDNELTSFDPRIALPSSLEYIGLINNQLTSFNPTIALPNSLIGLYLQNNQLTSFDPTIALPSSLVHLYLNNNQLTSFNPTITLPSSLGYLLLSDNQLTSFNPTITLPDSLQTIILLGNQLNTNEVNTTLVLLDTYTITVSNFREFDLRMDPVAPPSGAGLTAITSLQSKGYTVYTD